MLHYSGKPDHCHIVIESIIIFMFLGSSCNPVQYWCTAPAEGFSSVVNELCQI